MGLVLDSSGADAAEREGKNARQLLEAVALITREEDISISVLTLMELSQGLARANTSERRIKRQGFLSDLMNVLPIEPVTAQISLRAGEIDGECRMKGICIPLSDLLIGASALELGYQIATHNVRHFQLIPNLGIIHL